MDLESHAIQATYSLSNIQPFSVNPYGTPEEIWESIILPPGYTKPTKEAFTTKLAEIINAPPWEEFREERNKRISVCDWTQLPNAPLSGAKKYEWETYRQALRDLPRNIEDPSNPVWPIQPSP
jgi:hypothetical protein